MATHPNLKERLDKVYERIDNVLHQTFRSRAGLTVVAVTKRHPLAVVLKAYELGIRDFGESQIQEGIPKVKSSPEDAIWHLIGHLQMNKVRKAIKNFHYIHSIDSLSLLQRVENISGEERVCPKVFLQVNYMLDPDKHGLHPEAVKPLLKTALGFKHVNCIGLMGIPPLGCDPEKRMAFFEGMERMAENLRTVYPQWEGKLSLGMSDDYEDAIRAGSNYIRIGSILFGERH